MAPGNEKPRQRPHRPNDLGPRIYFRGRWAAADLRPWGGERSTLRDPSAFGWPAHGDRTDDPEVADRWKWAYVDHYRDTTKRKQLGLGPKPQSLGERADAFFAHRRRAVSDRTVATDETALRAHLVPQLGAGHRITEITQGQLQGVVDALLDSEYQIRSVSRMVSSWGAFFDWCGFGARNPARGLKLPKHAQIDTHAWSDAELKELRKVADRLDRLPVDRRENRIASIRLALELAVNTGGRQAELVALDWSSFQFIDRTVRFNKQVTHDRRGTKPLKGKTARTTLVLPGWWTFHRSRASGRVLTWRDAVPDLSTMYMQLMLLYDTAGLNGPGIGWHTLRHTYSRLFLEMGGRLEELQKSLGHKSIATTERYYEHFAPEAAATLARLRIYGDVSERVVRRRA